MSFPFSFNPLNFATRKRKVGEPDPINPDNIDFTNAMQPPAPQQGGHPVLSGLAAILQAAATGAGIGFSQDPAQALMQTLAQQRQAAMEKAKMAEDSRRQQVQIQSDKELENIRVNAQKGIQDSEHAFKKEEGAGADAQQLLVQSNQFKNAKDMQDSTQKAQVQLQQMQQDFEQNKMWDNQDFAKELETLKNSGDIKQAQSKTLMASLFHAMQNSRYVKGAPIPPSAVINITDKVGKGEALTKEDTDVIDRAFKASAAANAAAAKGQGSGGKEGRKDIQLQRQSQLDWEKNRRDLVNAAVSGARIPLLDGNGQQVKDINGNVQMVQATGPELLTRINDVLSVHDAVNPQPFSMQTAHPVPKGGTSEIRDVAALNAQIDQLATQHSQQDVFRIIDGSPNLNAAEKRQAKARAANVRQQSSSWNRFVGK